MLVMCVNVLSNSWLYSSSRSEERKKNRSQEVPQSQAAANPRHQEEEMKDKSQCVQNKQMHEKHTDKFSLPQAIWSQ